MAARIECDEAGPPGIAAAAESVNDDRQRREDARLVAGVLEDVPEAVVAFEKRLGIVERLIATQNAKLGRPLHAHDLADVAQEVRIIVWNKLERFDGARRLDAWLCRICVFEVMNHVRKKVRAPRMTSEVPADSLSDARHAQELALAERYDELHAGLDELDEEEASVIRLKHFDDHSFPEIAVIQDVALGTIKTRYYRGLLKLRTRLGSPRAERNLDQAARS